MSESIREEPSVDAVGLGAVDPARSRHAGRRSAVAVTDELVVAGLADGLARAFDRETLTERWRATESGLVEPVDDRTEELDDRKDAEEEGEVEEEDGDSPVVAATSFASGVALGTRGPAGLIRMHDAETGVLRWSYEAADDVGAPQRDTRFCLPFVADLVVQADRLYAAVRRYERDGDSRSFESVVYAFTPDGSVDWTFEADASPIALDVRDDRLAVAYNRCPGEFQHGLVVLDAVDGTERWHWDPGTDGQRRVGDVSLLHDGAVVASHGDYRGYRLLDGGAETWRVDLARPTTVGSETLYAYPNHVQATDAGAVFVTGNTYAEDSRETESLHPTEHTAVGVGPDGDRRWSCDVGGFASEVATEGRHIAVPGAQHFRTRTASAHGQRLLDVLSGLSFEAETEGILSAVALDDDALVAIEEPVAYHDGDATLGAYRLHRWPL